LRELPGREDQARQLTASAWFGGVGVGAGVGVRAGASLSEASSDPKSTPVLVSMAARSGVYSRSSRQRRVAMSLARLPLLESQRAASSPCSAAMVFASLGLT
jgi:hypothetical protein